MRIYIRKIDNQCISHQISVTKPIVTDFFENATSFTCETKHTHKIGTVSILPSTDYRFGGDIKSLLRNEGELENGDMVVFYKKADRYVVELIKTTNKTYDLYMQFFDSTDPRHTVFSMDDINFEDPDKSINELQKMSLRFGKLYSDENFLLEELNNLSSNEIADLLGGEYLENNCTDSHGKNSPVKTLRYIILKALLNKEKISIDSIRTIKSYINDGNQQDLARYFENKKVLESIVKQSSDKFETLWQKPYSVCYVFFYRQKIKKIIRENAEILFNNLQVDLKIDNLDIKIWDFNGSRNNGAANLYIALYPIEKEDARNSYQLVVDFKSGKMYAGIYKGSNINSDANLLSSDMLECNNYSDVLEVLNKHLDNFILWNSDTTDLRNDNAMYEDDTFNDSSENEDNFKKWMSRQISSRGAYFVSTSITSNTSALKKVCKLMKIDGYEGINSLFEITDVDVFYDIKSIIKQNPNYSEINKACGNRFLNTGLELYGKYLEEHSEQTVETQAETYTYKEFLDEVFISDKHYKVLLDLLKYKKNIILQGPPGVGKTFIAKRLAYSILGKKDDSRVEMIQFHQSYSYEDFIMGYKPTEDGFTLKEGVFYKFCKKAENDKAHEYFFIIDEINRGNLSRIFGEAMMLMENDKRNQSIKLAYRNEYFSIPSNMYVIGTMNTADRGLATIDYALRRRFSFFEIDPAFKLPSFEKNLQKNLKDQKIIKKIINRLEDLNRKISDPNNGLGEGFQIGHSYFCNKPSKEQSDEDWYDEIVNYEIRPLLEEYWWDCKDKVEDYVLELLKD